MLVSVYTVPVKIKFPSRSSKTLQSRFHVGKKTLNDFFKSDDFFTHRISDRSFYRTVFYCLLIYAHLTICVEDFLLLHPLIARLVALKQQLLFLFCFFVASVFVSGSIQTFTSASRHCHFHRRHLSVIRCRPSRPFIRSLLLLPPSLAIQSFISPSCRRFRHHSRFVVPSSASHSFTSASCHRHRWPAFSFS